MKIHRSAFSAILTGIQGRGHGIGQSAMGRSHIMLARTASSEQPGILALYTLGLAHEIGCLADTFYYEIALSFLLPLLFFFPFLQPNNHRYL